MLKRACASVARARSCDELAIEALNLTADAPTRRTRACASEGWARILARRSQGAPTSYLLESASTCSIQALKPASDRASSWRRASAMTRTSAGVPAGQHVDRRVGITELPICPSGFCGAKGGGERRLLWYFNGRPRSQLARGARKGDTQLRDARHDVAIFFRALARRSELSCAREHSRPPLSLTSFDASWVAVSVAKGGRPSAAAMSRATAASAPWCTRVKHGFFGGEVACCFPSKGLETSRV